MQQVYNFDELSTPLWIKVLFVGLYLVVAVYAVWKTLLNAPKDKRQVKVSGLVLLYFILYTMFYCINPDYFHYREWMTINMKEIGIEYWTNENIYAYLIMFCQSLGISYPYELFRLIVWGGALMLVMSTAKMYRSFFSPMLVVLFLFVFYSGTFSYARSSLSMALYFMGVGIFLWGKNGFIKLVGITLAMCSYFFHHEMLLGIVVLPSLILPLEKKQTLVFALIILAMMMGIIAYINSNLSLLETVFGADELADKIEHVNEKEQFVFRASTAVSYMNFFYPFILFTSFFYRRKNIPKPFVGIFRITFILLLAVISFFVVSGPRSTYTYRVLYITIIPLSILMAYFYNQGYFKNYHLYVMFFLAILTHSIRLFSSVQH